MKIVDDYKAKLKLWARSPRVVAMPRIEGLPRFGYRKFNSYEEMNAWKNELIRELMRQGGAKWKNV